MKVVIGPRTIDPPTSYPCGIDFDPLSLCLCLRRLSGGFWVVIVACISRKPGRSSHVIGYVDVLIINFHTQDSLCYL